MGIPFGPKYIPYTYMDRLGKLANLTVKVQVPPPDGLLTVDDGNLLQKCLGFGVGTVLFSS